MLISHSRNLSAGTIEHGTILQGNMVLYRLCTTVEDYGHQTEAKFADAKLFAAAPELLEALEACCRCLGLVDSSEEDIEALNLAEAAIRNAKGE